MAPLKILISGAGVAGNALAFWLSKLGHEVIIIERFPCLRVSGLQLDLRGHGIEVLKLMGLDRAFRDHAAPEQGLQVVDKHGKRVAYFPANKSGGKVQSFTSDYEIMRGELCQIIYDVTKDRAKYFFDASIESFEEKNDKLEVRFANGVVDTFDLLVGAEGAHSRTRRMMLGKDKPDVFHPLEECTAYFTLDRPIKDDKEYMATAYISPGPRMTLTRRHSPHKIQVYMKGSAVRSKLENENIKKGDVEKEKAAFAEDFKGAGWEVDAIIEEMKKSDDFYCDRQGTVKLDHWSKGRVSLVGDACYAPTSESGGMGTTSAMVGAYVLAGEIGRHCQAGDWPQEGNKSHIEAALKSYEEKFKPFMLQVQKGVGDKTFLDKVPWTASTVSVFNKAAGIAGTLRLDLLSGWFAGQKVKGWTLPQYEELLRA